MNEAATLFAAVALLGVAVAAPASSYAVAVGGDTTDVPAQSVPIDGEEFTVERVAVREQNGTVSVDAVGPEDDVYDVTLYDSDGDVHRSSRKSGGETTTTFGLDVDPGTYAVVVDDGTVQDLAAVVVAGYDVSLGAPDAAEAGDPVAATVELNRTAGGTVERVEVVVAGEETLRVPAEQTGETTYEATVDLDVPVGSYETYGVAFGPDTFENGENEILAVGAGEALTVESGDVADYAGADGVVDTAELRTAVDDWRTGQLDTAVLRDVVDHWRTGQPVE